MIKELQSKPTFLRARSNGAAERDNPEGNPLEPAREGKARAAERIKKFLPLVERIVRHLMKRLPSYLEFDDLHSVAVLGLLSAMRKFDPLQGKTFESYARMRIRGAILDELRRLDVMPRSARRKTKQLNAHVQFLEQHLGRAPKDEEIRQAMGLTREKFARLMRQVAPVNVISLDHDFTASENSVGTLYDKVADETQRPSYDRIQKQEIYDLVHKKMRCLPKRQKKILTLYYFEGMRLSEIAAVFEVSEARICQIHVQTLKKLRAVLGGVAA